MNRRQSTFVNVALVAKPGEPRVAGCLDQVVAVIEDYGLNLVMDEIAGEIHGTKNYAVRDYDTLFDDRDLVIAVGGDGTLLQAAAAASTHDLAVVGINLGRLGFLTDLNPQHVADGLNDILSGNYLVDERPILRCTLSRKGETVTAGYAVNDVVIQKWATAGLISFDTYVDGGFVHAQRSDGMIISTSTGSTAYALAGGGPIIHPSVAALALVPICPHSLTNRPVIVRDNANIEIVMTTEHIDQARVTCDGADIASLAPGDRIEISKHDKTVRLLHTREHNHFVSLRTKLNWGNDLC